jgi:hypothetical protein
MDSRAARASSGRCTGERPKLFFAHSGRKPERGAAILVGVNRLRHQ